VSSPLNGVTATYAYDGEGRRVRKGSVLLVYDAFGRAAAEVPGARAEGLPPPPLENEDWVMRNRPDWELSMEGRTGSVGEAHQEGRVLDRRVELIRE
jgi:hypothetical protein